MTKIYIYDIEKTEDLYSYLTEHQFIKKGELFLSNKLTGGVSNRTVLVKLENEQYVVKQGLEKLRVQEDWYSDPQRIHNEANGMIVLNKILPDGQVPEFIYLDKEQNILMMKAVEQPHANFKELLLEGKDQVELILEMAKLLSLIHRKAWGDKKIEKEFNDQTYFKELRSDPFFKFASEIFPETAKWFQKYVFDVQEIRNTLVHGDFSPKNILVKNKNLILLDHEVIHFGDFAFDYGFVMAHLFLKGYYLQSPFAVQYAQLFSRHYFKLMGDLLDDESKNRSNHLFLACVFARVAGKSKTNYLGKEKERKLQEVLLDWFSKEKKVSNNAPKQLLEKVLKHDKD